MKRRAGGVILRHSPQQLATCSGLVPTPPPCRLWRNLPRRPWGSKEMAALLSLAATPRMICLKSNNRTIAILLFFIQTIQIQVSLFKLYHNKLHLVLLVWGGAASAWNDGSARLSRREGVRGTYELVVSSSGLLMGWPVC